MIQFQVSKSLNARSTTFPLKETWYSAAGRVVSQIDRVLISNRFRSAITDIRVLKRPDIGSDHNLLKIKFKVKLRVKIENKYNEKRKIVSMFQNSKREQEYAIEINNRIESLENIKDEDNSNNNINDNWENIKSIIKETK